MSEATTDRALAGNGDEEEVLPPQPTTKAIILGEVVGSFLLGVLGLGIGVSATLWSAPGSPWFADIWPTAWGWARYSKSGRASGSRWSSTGQPTRRL